MGSGQWPFIPNIIRNQSINVFRLNSNLPLPGTTDRNKREDLHIPRLIRSPSQPVSSISTFPRRRASVSHVPFLAATLMCTNIPGTTSCLFHIQHIHPHYPKTKRHTRNLPLTHVVVPTKSSHNTLSPAHHSTLREQELFWRYRGAGP